MEFSLLSREMGGEILIMKTFPTSANVSISYPRPLNSCKHPVCPHPILNPRRKSNTEETLWHLSPLNLHSKGNSKIHCLTCHAPESWNTGGPDYL